MKSEKEEGNIINILGRGTMKKKGAMKMVAVIEAREEEKERSFETQYGRFQQAVKDGQEVEAFIIRSQILMDFKART